MRSRSGALLQAVSSEKKLGDAGVIRIDVIGSAMATTALREDTQIRKSTDPFARVRELGRGLAGVEEGTSRGAPALADLPETGWHFVNARSRTRSRRRK